MSNLYDALKRSNAFRKIEIDDLLFVEYSCDPGGPKADIWSHNGYFTYVVSGRMNLKMADRVYEIRAGEAYFITRGGFTVPEFYDEVFCDMIIFVPDDFIRSVIDRYQIRLTESEANVGYEAVIPLQLDPSLIQYYRSLFTYLQSPDPPSRILMKIKLEELLRAGSWPSMPSVIFWCRWNRSNYLSISAGIITPVQGIHPVNLLFVPVIFTERSGKPLVQDFLNDRFGGGSQTKGQYIGMVPDPGAPGSLSIRTESSPDTGYFVGHDAAAGTGPAHDDSLVCLSGSHFPHRFQGDLRPVEGMLSGVRSVIDHLMAPVFQFSDQVIYEMGMFVGTDGNSHRQDFYTG